MAISEPTATVVDRLPSAPPTMAVRATLLTIVVFFGGSLPAYKLASESFGPATTNLVRFVLAAVMLPDRGADAGYRRRGITSDDCS